MEVGATIRLEIDSISAGGDGVGLLNGKVVFVPASAPGDTLAVHIDSVRKGFARASIIEVIQASPTRSAEAYCPLLKKCGGCNLGHLQYEAQLQAKHDIVSNALARIGKIDVPSFSVHASPPLGYRNRAQFHSGPNGYPAYMLAGSSQMLEPAQCPVLIAALNSWLDSERTSERTTERTTEHSAERTTEHSAERTTERPAERTTASGRSGLPVGQRYAVFSPGDRVYVEGRDTEFSFKFNGKTFCMTPSRFFQSNLLLLPALVAAVCDGMSGKRAADLYCGIGLFGSWLKERFESLYCVEQDIEAVRLASRNVGKGASFAAQSMDDWVQGNQARTAFDYVVLDPPRTGLSLAVRQWLISTGPPVLAYVSCDPVSLARDLGDISVAYAIERFDAFDFYPQTAHVECCVRLIRTR